MSLQARLNLQLDRLQLDVNFEVAEGEVVAILGPNGAGKTTLLKAVAGLLRLAEGHVAVGETVLEDVAAGVRLPPERRPIGVVFQDYLLFPHLDALENVAFGLRCRGATRTAAARDAAGWLQRMGLAALARARPHQLSGGQAQRVALARALATHPRVLLLDEPLSALDATTRAEVRRVLRRQLADFDGVRLLVTHDALEAVALADRLIVLEGGRVIQAGTPAEVTQRPRSAYVADLAGVNLYRGHATAGRLDVDGGGSLHIPTASEGDLYAAVHPRTVALFRSRPEGTPRNVWQGKVDALDLHGDRVRVSVSGQISIVAEVTPAAVSDLALAEADQVWVAVKASEISVYPA